MSFRLEEIESIENAVLEKILRREDDEIEEKKKEKETDPFERRGSTVRMSPRLHRSFNSSRLR